MEDYFDALRFGLPRMPALAHRLDKETSGCLVLGRHRKALADLNLLFRNGKVGKTYWAVVEGGPEADEGRIDMPLGRLDDTRGWWMKHDPAGLPSSTTWKVMGRADGLDLAGARAADRADASVARALLRVGLADPRRQHLRQARRATRRACICTRARSWCRSTGTSRRSGGRAGPPHMRERLKACGWDEELDKKLVTPPAPSRPRRGREASQ